MSFFRLRSHAGNQWPALPDAALSQVWSAYLALDRTQWLDPDEIERQQFVQLRALLEHSVTHVPYYRDLFAQTGIAISSLQSRGDLKRLPLLPRRTWQEHFERFCAAEVPPGTVVLDEDNTSGTSGAPIRILKTNIYYVWWLAFYLRDLEWSGLNPKNTMAVIRATLKTGTERENYLRGQRLPCWQPILAPLLETNSLYVMDLDQDPRRQLEWLGEVNPDYLLSHTSNLELLAGFLLDDPRPFPKLQAIQAISETLTEEARQRIEAAFGAPVKNLYSCAEAGYLASPCPAGHGLHIHAENAIFEVLNEYDQPCAPGETGRVVLTTLHNFCNPFIRYEIGDVVTLGPRRCPCGRGLPTLTQVLGKRRPEFHLLGGRFKHSSGLVHAISGVGGHYQHQAIQKALDHIVVRIVPNRTWLPDSAARLRKVVEEFFESPIRVDVELLERLELPRGGKLQSMICEIPMSES